MAAGIAFCYMTQLGRYATIVGRPLGDYRLIQDLAILDSGMDPLRTQVCVRTTEGEDYGKTLVEMGAQTCFLHAACQSEIPVEIRHRIAGT